MPEFLKLQPPFIALDKFLMEIPETHPKTERIETGDSLGRVLAFDFISPHPLPQFPRSTVDGYAVRCSDTHGASTSMPAILKLAGEAPMGKIPDMIVAEGGAILIHTGGMIPDGADAVVMLENTQLNTGNDLEVYKAVGKNENLILIGQDVKAGEVVIPAGRVIRPVEIGGLMSFGQTIVEVNQKPIVGILSSGDEVIPPSQIPNIGQVRDINTSTMSALVHQSGGESITYPIVSDSEEAMTRAVQKAFSECDIVLITAGSSASTRDLTSIVIEKLGKPGILAHGVNVRPGKPTILAVCDSKPVIGLPGNPVSALVIADLFVKPVVRKLLGITDTHIRARINANLMSPIVSIAGREDWIPAQLAQTAEGYNVAPIFFVSNLIFNLVKANSLIHIPADVTGVQSAEIVGVELL